MVKFLDAGGEYAGGIYIYFNSRMHYDIGWCSSTYVNFPTTLPSSPNKIWRITLKRTSTYPRLLIHCNGVEVLNVLISDSVCRNSNWEYDWGRKVGKIQFQSGYTASDYYRPYTGKCYQKVELYVHCVFLK